MEMPCRTHLERSAAFLCRGCNVYACDDCARHTWVTDHFEDCCPRCGAAMEPIRSGDATGHDRGAGELVSRLPELWTFIRRPSLLMILVGLTLIVAPLSWAVEFNISPIVALFGYAVIVGLELSIYFQIVVQTAYGSDEISPPEFSDIHTDFIGPTFRFLAAMLPIVLGVLWYADQAFEGELLLGLAAFQLDPLAITGYPGPASIVAIGLAVLPLLTVVAAMSHSTLTVLNPLAAARNLRILGASYWVGAAVFYGILLIEKLLVAPALEWLVVDVDIPVLSRMLALFIGYLPFALRARVLGLMVQPYLRSS